jgi:carbonic anhydrase
VEFRARALCQLVTGVVDRQTAMIKMALEDATGGPAILQCFDGKRTDLLFMKGQVMRPPTQLSRREFVHCAALAAGAVNLTVPSTGLADQKPGPKRDPDAVLTLLLEGNTRFVKGEAAQPRRKPDDFARLAEGQAPLAVIVACADSRVAPEPIFDQGLGELFVVRVAGNIISGAGASVKGSIEYAVAELGVRLIVVLGHSQCGAVKAAIKHIDANDALPGAINDLVGTLKPSVTAANGKPGDLLDNVIKANVERGVERLRSLEPILAGAVKKEQLKVVGATYELRTGKVTVLG